MMIAHRHEMVNRASARHMELQGTVPISENVIPLYVCGLHGNEITVLETDFIHTAKCQIPPIAVFILFAVHIVGIEFCADCPRSLIPQICLMGIVGVPLVSTNALVMHGKLAVYFGSSNLRYM
uniref:Uncharacterized protein n=2 Tax=Proboscia inermis TaxID=420281 RepID=A0A7S0CEQ1_9STRA